MILEMLNLLKFWTILIAVIFVLEYVFCKKGMTRAAEVFRILGTANLIVLWLMSLRFLIG